MRCWSRPGFFEPPRTSDCAPGAAPGAAAARAAAAYRGVSMLSVAPRLLLQRLADVMAARDGKRQLRQYAHALGVRHVTLAYEAVQADPRAEMRRLLGAAGIATAGLPAEVVPPT